MKILKGKRKKKKWDWLLDLFDLLEVLGQILWWMVRGAIRFIGKFLNKSISMGGILLKIDDALF